MFKELYKSIDPKAIHAVVLTLSYVAGIRDVLKEIGPEKIDISTIKNIAYTLGDLSNLLKKYESELVMYLPKSTAPEHYSNGWEELVVAIDSARYAIEDKALELYREDRKLEAYGMVLEKLDYLIYMITYIISVNYF